jgi:HD-like signal output (HDOD) protein
MTTASIPDKDEMEKAYQVIRKLRVPSVPDIVVEVQKLLQEPNLRIDMITSLINQDAGLTGEVLKAARSPIYGLSEDVTTIQHAVKVLGIKRLGEIAVAVSLKSALAPMNAFHVQIWEESLMIASGCAWLANESANINRDEAYLAGLFSNIGCMLLEQASPKYEILYEKARSYPITCLDLEERLITTNHSVVGFITAQLWSLPPEVCAAIYHIHDTNLQSQNLGDTAALVGMVRIVTACMEEIRMTQTQETMEYLKFLDSAREEFMLDDAAYEELKEFMESLL